MSETKKGLGDYIEAGIEKVMPKTAARVKKKGGCGCGKSKEAFNQLGEALTK